MNSVLPESDKLKVTQLIIKILFDFCNTHVSEPWKGTKEAWQLGNGSTFQEHCHRCTDTGGRTLMYSQHECTSF